MPDNEDQLTTFPDNTILIHNYEVLALYAEGIDTTEPQPQIHVNFFGRVNGTDDTVSQNVALNIDHSIRLIEIMSSAIAAVMIREGMITEEEFNRD